MKNNTQALLLMSIFSHRLKLRSLSPLELKHNKKSKDQICIDLWFKQGKQVSQSDRDPLFKNYWYQNDEKELLIHWQVRAYTNWQGKFVSYHFLLNRLNRPIGKFKHNQQVLLRLISYNPVFRLRDRRMEGDFATYTDDNQKLMISDLMESDPDFANYNVAEIFKAFSAFMDKYITSYAQNEKKNISESYSRNIDDIVKRPVSLESINSIRQTLAKPGINKSKLLASYVLLSFILAKGDRDFNLLANPIIIFEDIDARFHPTMLLSFFSLVAATAAQKIITTNSGDLLSATNLESLRRLQKSDNETSCYYLQAGVLNEEELRKIAFHIRINRPLALFARSWILVEVKQRFGFNPDCCYFRYGSSL